MRILMVGDIIGRPGRRAVSTLLPELRRELALDLVIANGENAAGGFGLTLEVAQELLRSGVDVITSGNHIWDQREIIPHLEREMPLLRPLNYPPSVPGRGVQLVNQVLVVNLQGRVFMDAVDCPFRAMDHLLEELKSRIPKVIVVDMHAEATSEKQALGWYLDGRVSAVLGTHTHVGTVDTRVLPQGTGFVTDVGMVGPLNSVIGTEVQVVLERFLTQTPRRFTVPGGPVRWDSVLVEVDEETGKATGLQRFDRVVE
ncbi:MAG: TIGR00282 family metallophosphoesterase [Dehalococcoidia bacterium]